MGIPSIQPPNLKKEDFVRIVAPGGPVFERTGLDRGIATLERIGFRVDFDERIFQRTRYLAGADRDRAEELMSAFEDPSVAAIMALRGGYGCSRLIPYLQEKRMRRNPKLLVGFSDLTTLHLYLQRRFGWISIHGPMVVSQTMGDLPEDQALHFFSLLTDPEYRPALSFEQMETWATGTAEGILTGGCLAIVEASIGTAYEIETEGKILFLEDQGEAPYKLDRMITHLFLAGKLQSVAGILLGTFLDCEPEDQEYSSSDVLKEKLQELHVPILANFPAGHGFNNWALPLGARVRIDAMAKSVEFLDPAVSHLT